LGNRAASQARKRGIENIFEQQGGDDAEKWMIDYC
jgi:hypothetical protein